MKAPMGSHDPYAGYRELTLRGMILGAIITIIFTASNVYLGLKVGLTFASSIPAAVISMAVLKMCHGSNILENNMVQTQASAAGTLSSIIFVLPGLLMMGYWSGFPFWQTTFICMAGGILGVIFTIPLRHVMVVKSPLPYPEGVAAAEILKAGESNEYVNSEGKKEASGAKQILAGSIFAGTFSLLSGGLRIVNDSASYWFKSGNAIFQLPMGFSFALLGAGYLVGITGGIAMLVGMFFAWGMAVPYFSSIAPMPEGMDMVTYAMGLWKNKVRFIGAGTIGIAAIWTLITLLKPMIDGMRLSFEAVSGKKDTSKAERVDQDLSPKWMVIISLSMLTILAATFYSFVAAAPISTGLAWGLVACATLLAFVIGFLVAAACGYMAGLIGSSASPISGIGIISIVLISLVLMLIGTSTDLFATEAGRHFATALALFVASAVLAIATISNDNLQDLKTGYLVKATPWRQQVALIIGCIVGALVISPVLELLYHAYGFTGAMPRADMDPSQALAAPQATLMTTIAQGIFSSNLEWVYIYTGIGIGVALIALDTFLKKNTKNLSIPPLAVGMGIYLPASVNMPMVIGTIISYLSIRHIYKRNKGNQEKIDAELKTSERRGTLFAAGLIVGESMIGVILAMVIVASITAGGSEAPLAIHLDNWENMANLLGLAAFIAGMYLMGKRVFKR